MFKNIPWTIVIILAAIQLVRPVLSIAGFFDDIGSVGRILATAVIGILWVAIAVFKRLEKPVVVLAAAGVFYAVTSIVLAVIIQAFFPGIEGEESASIPLLLTAGLVSTTVINIIWGAVLGFIAQIIMRFMQRSQKEQEYHDEYDTISATR